MQYSAYILQLHLPFLTHAHNLFLDIWLEQGMLGLLALFWLIVLVLIQARRSISPWRRPALAALAVIALHGLVDDAFYGYGGAGMVLAFLPLALLASGADPVHRSRNEMASSLCPVPDPATRELIPFHTLKPRTQALSVVLSLLLVVILVIFVSSGRPNLQSNLAALAQSRAELAVFRWPAWPVQDAIRRWHGMDMERLVAGYQAVLARDPDNITANRRLGQIELSLGQYEQAVRHLEAALAADPGQSATRRLLGEAYAVTGDVQKASGLWSTVDMSLGQPALRRWWYDHVGEPERATWIAEAAR